MSRAENMRRAERALVRLAAPHACLAPDRGGRGFAIFAHGDRRRRPVARLSEAEVRALHADGAIVALDDKSEFSITPAGLARARRAAAAPEEAYAAQHRPIVTRALIEPNGAARSVRGHDPDAVLRKLIALRGAAGAPWLSDEEIRAAQRLRYDWERGHVGLVRGIDFAAPPISGGARGPGAAQQASMAAGCDARARVQAALGALAAPLRRVVERVCLNEEALEAFERREHWPPRSGKIALKLALAQIVAHMAGAARA
jgi:hypothetical protein